MLYVPTPNPWVLPEPAELLPPPQRPTHKDPLRHLLLGSPAAVQQAVHRLHVLHYAEQFRWSQPIAVPPTGLTLTPYQGDILRYLVLDNPT